MRTRGPRSRLRFVAPLVIAGTLTLATTAASGIEPAGADVIPDSAFRPVLLPLSSAGTSKAVGPPTADPRPTADLSPIVEPAPAATAPPERPQPRVREPKPIVVLVAPPEPKGGASGGATAGASISGNASWYCRAGWSPCTVDHPDTNDFDAYAAAGPRLREAIGPSWRGTIVRVDGIRVKLIDWCQCYRGEPNEKLLDLYYDVYRRTGSPVVVSW